MSHPYDNMTEPELNRHFNDVGRTIQATLPEGTHFILLAAPEEGRVAQYVSNVQRPDAAAWMRETLARWEMNDLVER